MGSGKTTIAKLLSRKLCFDCIDMDQILEDTYSMSIFDIFKNHGEEKFREAETKLLSEILVKKNIVVSTGGGTPCFADNMDNMNLLGKTVYLQTGLDILKNRLVSEPNKRPLLKNIELHQLGSFVAAKLAERELFYTKATLIVNTDKYTPQQIVNIIYSIYAPKPNL